MSPESPLPSSAPAAPSAHQQYRLAVLLAGFSAGLGLLRELYVLKVLRLSALNDALQYYLSIVYTISLLGDPIRLAALNLLQERGRAATVGIVSIVAIPAMVIVTVAYAMTGGVHDTRLLIASGIGGGLNLYVAVGLSDGQRSRSFIGTQAVMAIPNIILIIGVVLVPALTSYSLADAIVYLYMVVPAVQVVSFWLMPELPTAPKPTGSSDSSVWSGLKQLLLHSTSAGGSMLGQFALRTTLTGATVGSLSIVSLLVRIYDTVRVIFVDSFVGSRVVAWTTGGAHVPTLLDARRHAMPLAVVSAAALAAALFPSSGLVATSTISLGILMVALYAASSLRVLYSFVNTIDQPARLVAVVGAADIAVGLAAVGMAFVPSLPRLALLWTLYVGRSLVLLWFVVRHPALDQGTAKQAASE